MMHIAKIRQKQLLMMIFNILKKVNQQAHKIEIKKFNGLFQINSIII